jgi:hypothetical protein
MAHELIQKELEMKGQKTVIGANKATNLTGFSANSGLSSNSYTQIDADPNSKVVLTLYGNAPQPKQLFSSFQLSTKVDGESRAILQTLQEDELPNGITTTQIVPNLFTGSTDDRKHIQTLGQLYPLPPSVPTLSPPKPSKLSTTRSSTVGWYQATATDANGRSGTYSKQTISSGQWLDYSNASQAPSAKKKQRERAISLVGVKPPQIEADPAGLETAKLDSLFRSMYSGFAPAKDNAAAIVPDGQISRIWWQQVGEKIFEQFVQNETNVEGATLVESVRPGSGNLEEVDEEKIKEIINNWETEAIDPNLESVAEKSAEEKEVEEVLEGISELLETLNSHQRNRNLVPIQTNRPGLLSASDTNTIAPPKPSDSELATYEILKSQLTLMIATLPPFAVAKLDSNQLAELATSTKIEVQLDDHKGVMEEDEASRSKLSAASVSAPRPAPSPVSVQRTSSSSLYGNQYTASRPAQAPTQYYGPSQTPVRAQPSPMPRPPSAAQLPYQSQQRPHSSTPYRPTSYGTPTTYGQQAPRLQQQYAPQYQQNSSQSYRPSSQSYQNGTHHGVQPPASARYSGQPSYSQQTPSQNGAEYRYGASVAHQSSPPKQLYNPQPSTQSQSRPSYSTPSQSFSQDRRPYNPMAQSYVNGGAAPPSQSHNGPLQLGPTNYSTFMTDAEQSSMMERQRAQLAHQQGLQQQARTAAQAAVMGSPSRSHLNGSSTDRLPVSDSLQTPRPGYPGNSVASINY